MTIALGVMSMGGIVLAADSQISTDQDLKGVDTKIVAVAEQGGNVAAVAGSGSVGYFKSIRLKAAMATITGMGASPFSTSAVEHELENLLVPFYERHVLPFKDFANPPDVALLIAGFSGTEASMFATNKSTISSCLHFDAIGSGGPYATSLLSGYLPDGNTLSLEATVLLACYVMMQTKQTIMGCGHETQIALLRPGLVRMLPRKLIQKCEHELENFAFFRTQAFYAVAGVAADTGYAKEGLDALRGSFDHLRQEIRAMSSPSSQT